MRKPNLAAACALVAGLAALTCPIASGQDNPTPAPAATPAPAPAPNSSEPPPDRTEISLGWRPSFREVKYVVSTGDAIRGDDFDFNEWRAALKVPGITAAKLEADADLEYMEKSVTERTGRFVGFPTPSGGFSAHEFDARLWMARPIGLDDAGMLRLTPQAGLIIKAQTGGYGTFPLFATRGMANNAELGLLLGAQVERLFDVQDTNRIGGSIQTAFMPGELNADDELGHVEMATEMRIQLWWNTRITDSLRFEVRYMFTWDVIDYRESLRPGNALGLKQEEIDDAIFLGFIYKL